MIRRRFFTRHLLLVISILAALSFVDIHAQPAALIVVDIQTDFTDNDQYVSKEKSDQLIEQTNQVIEIFQQKQLPVIYTKAPLKKLLISPEGEKKIVKEASDLHPNLTLSGTYVYEKTAADALRSEEVYSVLKKHGTEKVFVVGLMVEDCLSKTALGSARSGFQTFVVQDAIAARAPTTQKKYIDKMQKKGITIIKLSGLENFLP